MPFDLQKVCQSPSAKNEMSNQAVISIGSNIDAELNIPKALKHLSTFLTIVRQVPFITTTPIGITNQPDFTNGAILCKTSLDMDQLVRQLKTTEDILGRDRTREKYGPREIDLDVVTWNGQIVDQDYYSRTFLKKMTDDLLTHPAS